MFRLTGYVMWLTPLGVLGATAWIEKLKLEEMRDSDSLLLGRTTYQTFAESRPGRKGELAELMNGAAKYVASKTKGELAWSTALTSATPSSRK